MNKPKRIQRKRIKNWRMPVGTIYVGRPSKWGNPFTGENAVELYRQAVSGYPVPPKQLNEWKTAGGNPSTLLLLAKRDSSIIDYLRGKDLACWCTLDKPCHADILLEIVNSLSK